MALTFSLIRSETRREENPELVLQNVNQSLLTMNASGMFVTLIYCVLNFRTGHMRYARAGHPLPVVMDASGKCLDIPMKEGQPLGIFPNVKIDNQEIQLPQGGLALLFSDGLVEAMDSKGQEFGLGRVRAEFARFRKASANEICHKLWEAVESHCDEHLHQDDFTAVVIKRE
jgi:serine phosphatase RsbU (regulator of sigma subunit)